MCFNDGFYCLASFVVGFIFFIFPFFICSANSVRLFLTRLLWSMVRKICICVKSQSFIPNKYTFELFTFFIIILLSFLECVYVWIILICVHCSEWSQNMRFLFEKYSEETFYNTKKCHFKLDLIDWPCAENESYRHWKAQTDFYNQKKEEILFYFFFKLFKGEKQHIRHDWSSINVSIYRFYFSVCCIVGILFHFKWFQLLFDIFFFPFFSLNLSASHCSVVGCSVNIVHVHLGFKK